MLTRELSDKVELGSVSQVSVKCPVTQAPHANEGEKSNTKGAMKTRVKTITCLSVTSEIAPSRMRSH